MWDKERETQPGVFVQNEWMQGTRRVYFDGLIVRDGRANRFIYKNEPDFEGNLGCNTGVSSIPCSMFNAAYPAPESWDRGDRCLSAATSLGITVELPKLEEDIVYGMGHKRPWFHHDYSNCLTVFDLVPGPYRQCRVRTAHWYIAESSRLSRRLAQNHPT